MMAPKRRMVNRTESIGTEIGPRLSEKICLPLGNLSVLPLEIFEEILWSLPSSAARADTSVQRSWLGSTTIQFGTPPEQPNQAHRNPVRLVLLLGRRGEFDGGMFVGARCIASLALTSREWMSIISDWLSSARTTRRLTAELVCLGRRVGDSQMAGGVLSASALNKERSLFSFCADLGCLIRLATLFVENGKAMRLYWLRRILTELGLNWKSPDSIVRALGAFLKNCFVSCESEALEEVMQIVNSKIRIKTYVRTQLKYGPGCKKDHEKGTRNLARSLFTDYHIFVAFLKFCIKNCGQDGRLCSRALGRLVCVIYGPVVTKNAIDQIGWSSLSSISIPLPPSSVEPLANFLNMLFRKKTPDFFTEKHLFLTDDVLFTPEEFLHALLGSWEMDWSEKAIGALMVYLEVDLSVSFLAVQTPRAAAIILVEVGKNSSSTMAKLLDRLKHAIKLEARETLLNEIHWVIVEEIESQKELCRENCGDCSNCSFCPLETLKILFNTLKMSQSPVKPRRSKRLLIRALDRPLVKK